MTSAATLRSHSKTVFYLSFSKMSSADWIMDIGIEILQRSDKDRNDGNSV